MEFNFNDMKWASIYVLQKVEHVYDVNTHQSHTIAKVFKIDDGIVVPYKKGFYIRPFTLKKYKPFNEVTNLDKEKVLISTPIPLSSINADWVQNENEIDNISRYQTIELEKDIRFFIREMALNTNSSAQLYNDKLNCYLEIKSINEPVFETEPQK